MRAKRLFKKLKHPEEEERLSSYSDRKNFQQDEKVNAGNDRWLAIVNVGTDAYVETLQASVVKPPWINGLANGGRPYVFQLDSAPSHKALTTHDWMYSREFSSPCHT
ncbi:hypothetical protein ACTXT7_016924 [Hymenolepis weldensis]